MDPDRDHLRLLATFHWVVAGLAALFSLFPLFYVVIGIAMLAMDSSKSHSGRGGDLFGWFFILLGIGGTLSGLGFATALACAAKFLSERSHYRYCLVVAAIACAFMPFGTVLGVFTIIVLMRPSVRALFVEKPWRPKLPGPAVS